MADAFGKQVAAKYGGPERRVPESRRALLARISAAFDSMAGLSLTRPQACRLFHLTNEGCERILNELLNEGVLATDGQGHLVRGGRSPSA